MRRILDKFGRLLAHVDDLELLIPAVIAAALLIIGPLVATCYWLRSGHHLAAIISACLWILTVATGIRDFRRGRFGAVSLVVGMIWLLATLAILWKLEAL